MVIVGNQQYLSLGQFLNKQNHWVDLFTFNAASKRKDGTKVIKDDGYVELAYGLIIPDRYTDIFIKAEEFATTLLLPEKSINGYAYLIKEDELVLGPFQGPVACTRIKKGRGVCGTSWERATTVIVEDVEKFPGHIACSSSSKSEIVIPVYKNGTMLGVLDVDSSELAQFDSVDQMYLERILQLIP